MSASDCAVVLPARDEEGAVQAVVNDFAALGARVVVVDNGSHDSTAALAQAAGAEVVREDRPGYGRACLRGVAHLRPDAPEFIAFADCDGTVAALDLGRVLEPLRRGTAELCLGRRAQVEPGAYPWHQRWGNRMILGALHLLAGPRLGDVPPLRAIRFDALLRLGLREATYGFPVETIAACARRGLRIAEVDVRYRRRRHGQSKVSGSLARSITAGGVMLGAMVRARRAHPRPGAQVVVFARAPELGRVKTRLQRKIPASVVLDLYRAFLRDTLLAARLAGARVVLAHSPSRGFEEQGLADVVFEQRGPTFAARFDQALADAHQGSPRTGTLILGADAPHLSPEAIGQAINLMKEGAAVIGPSPRGGFYLLGFPGKPIPVADVFEHADQVSALSTRLEANGLRVGLVDPWFDIDEENDLARLKEHLLTRPAWIPPRTYRILLPERPRPTGATIGAAVAVVGGG